MLKSVEAIQERARCVAILRKAEANGFTHQDVMCARAAIEHGVPVAEYTVPTTAAEISRHENYTEAE